MILSKRMENFFEFALSRSMTFFLSSFLDFYSNRINTLPVAGTSVFNLKYFCGLDKKGSNTKEV